MSGKAEIGEVFNAFSASITNIAEHVAPLVREVEGAKEATEENGSKVDRLTRSVDALAASVDALTTEIGSLSGIFRNYIESRIATDTALNARLTKDELRLRTLEEARG